jgi:hypothetical protein
MANDIDISALMNSSYVPNTGLVDQITATAQQTFADMTGIVSQIQGQAGEVNASARAIDKQTPAIVGGIRGAAAHTAEADRMAAEQAARAQGMTKQLMDAFGWTTAPDSALMQNATIARKEDAARAQSAQIVNDILAVNPLDDPLSWIIGRVQLPFEQQRLEAHTMARDGALSGIAQTNNDIIAANQNFQQYTADQILKIQSEQSLAKSATADKEAAAAIVNNSHLSAGLRAQAGELLIKTAQAKDLALGQLIKAGDLSLHTTQLLQQNDRLVLEKIAMGKSIEHTIGEEAYVKQMEEKSGVQIPYNMWKQPPYKEFQEDVRIVALKTGAPQDVYRAYSRLKNVTKLPPDVVNALKTYEQASMQAGAALTGPNAPKDASGKPLLGADAEAAVRYQTDALVSAALQKSADNQHLSITAQEGQRILDDNGIKLSITETELGKTLAVFRSANPNAAVDAAQLYQLGRDSLLGGPAGTGVMGNFQAWYQKEFGSTTGGKVPVPWRTALLTYFKQGGPEIEAIQAKISNQAQAIVAMNQAAVSLAIKQNGTDVLGMPARQKRMMMVGGRQVDGADYNQVLHALYSDMGFQNQYQPTLGIIPPTSRATPAEIASEERKIRTGAVNDLGPSQGAFTVAPHTGR